MPNGAGLHVIGDDVTLDGAALLAPGGNFTILSAGSPGQAAFNLAAPGAGYAAATFPTYGSISLTNGARTAARW